MLVAVSSIRECRGPAFFESTVTKSTVLFAGHDLGTDHLVRAARNKAWTCTAAVFGTKTLALRGGGAARHGARLLLVSTVSGAMRSFRSFQTSGAPCKLALSIRTMFGAKTACTSKSVATFHFADFRAAAAVLATPSP